MSRRPWSPVRITAAVLSAGLMVAGVLGTIAPAQAVGSIHASIIGSGSTWSANALQQWIRNVFATYDWKVTYSESGSTQGRNDFANGVSDFGVSEIPYGIANSNEADSLPNRDFAYMPIVAGGTAFMYNLEIGGKRVANLRLSGESLALIFTGQITIWNDPRIAEDNPGLASALPATPIVPVVRSDGSGTSAQFTLWMRQELPDIWNAYCDRVGRPRVADGNCGVTSNYPTAPGSGFIAKAGANGVAGYVAQDAAVGSITFVEYSYALNSGFPVVKMLNSAGYYTEPTASNVAVALLRAMINEDRSSQNYLTQDLTNVYRDGDPRTYPLSSYSYIILPTSLEGSFTEDKGLTLADFTSYFLCEGQQQAETLGYSPLPVNLVLGGQSQVQQIPGGNPSSTDFTIGECNNPTLDPNDPNGNALANNAPFPAECDRVGATQCSDGTGGAAAISTQTAVDPAAAAAAAGNAAQANAAGPGVTDTAVIVSGSPQSIPTALTGVANTAAVIGGGTSFLLSTVLPPLLGRRQRRSMFQMPSGQNKRSSDER